MMGPERGLLLLCADLGDGLTPLTGPQLRRLRLRLREAPAPADPDRDLTAADLRALGLGEEPAARIVRLLQREAALDAYLSLGAEKGIVPLTLRSQAYPARLRRVLGDDAPPVLFARGDTGLLRQPFVALVGSRRLRPAGTAFASAVGKLAAAEDDTLVSGNASGADRTAQDACLAAGGRVVSFVADALCEHNPAPGQLLLSEHGWQLPFSPFRALSRNRLIHALAEKTLVAQVGLTGGTRAGAEENLRRGWSPVFVHDDGSPGSEALIFLGAEPVTLPALTSLGALRPSQTELWENFQKI